MKRGTPLILLLALVIAAGCSGRGEPTVAEPPGAVPAQAPALAAAEEEGPDLLQVAAPSRLSTAELTAGLRRYVNQGEGPIAGKLAALYDQWGLQPTGGSINQAEADLDGDGATETVTALTGAGPGVTGRGALFVLHRSGDRWAVDRSEEVPGPRLHQVADLTGDGRPEVVWSSTDAGAHTSFSTVFVSAWKPGALVHLPGSLSIPSMEVALEGRDLLLKGGIIGSAGAGAVQRPRTDRYRFDGHSFQLVDREYAPSVFGYHRLMDGIVAEEFGRTDDAHRAFREATEPGRTPLGDGMVPAEWQERFGAAVRTFARMRLTLLLAPGAEEGRRLMREAAGPYAGLVGLVLAAPDRTAACAAAAEYAENHPAFLEALNSPNGYAHPRWLPADLCGPLPPES